MNDTQIIEVKRNILDHNDRIANAFRAERKAEGTFLMDIMGSPGAGKTSVLLALIGALKKQEENAKIGVIEADLESDVDALKIKEAGIPSVELNTKGVCHVDMSKILTIKHL